jgi:periplasmic protein TonB
MMLLNTDIVCNLPVPETRKSSPVKKTELTSTIAVAATTAAETQSVSQEDPFEPTQLPIAAPVAPVLSDEPLIMADEMPEPLEGFQKFYKQIGRNLRYPRKAAASEIEGKVFVEFVIDREGSVTNIKVLKGIGYGCDEEAVKALAKTKWKAGKQHGVPVKVRMVLPIKFSLTK